MTLFVSTVTSVNTAIKIIKTIENYSGIQLNENKTKAIWLGTNNPTNTIGNMLWEDVYVKSIGLYFCKNKDKGLEMNWSKERTLNMK